MPISWNEIRHNAIAFAKEWATETREEAEAKSFWDEFFQVFGIRRRTVASFEEPVKKLSGNWGYIDLFWPGTVLVEHKSLGKPLSAAPSQAKPWHGMAWHMSVRLRMLAETTIFRSMSSSLTSRD